MKKDFEYYCFGDKYYKVDAEAKTSISFGERIFSSETYQNLQETIKIFGFGEYQVSTLPKKHNQVNKINKKRYCVAENKYWLNNHSIEWDYNGKRFRVGNSLYEVNSKNLVCNYVMLDGKHIYFHHGKVWKTVHTSGWGKEEFTNGKGASYGLKRLGSEEDKATRWTFAKYMFFIEEI